ncbi:DeoR/GlpR family DNA-binding transcription regulator [Enterobacter chuandaensis]|uniref:DeoR/GlpR family DNA-binding transcription regulator n=1 Tax=Enterobacter chuandaensis TaxID=2497875 RepID=A0AA96M7U8_9ENTR|nr:DeoR/GlpR family DNA-binding transcription regulator [Enterobacter chuandaensis]MCW4783766.1 DeoR/GlpR family DNA-binding transcription regulator [Enterobacter chuandaensis]MDA4757937.1 DeoR/GlpR family DNA-binding transcription regulator [Enterobacter chuandaensis]WNS38593.1 DeoR/GlpR family DNA-binding transcription regulator [Enterobacter chuandaensis]
MLDYAALPEQRQERIRQILQESGRVICTELASQMKVSEHTIRRDLHELSKEGYCKKVYGGAVLQLPDAGNFFSREQKISAEKHTIAQKAATLIQAGGCIFIDAGTTNLALAKALPADLNVTVVTNSPAIAAELLHHPLCEVIITGGQIQRASGGTVGATAASQIQGIIFDQAFIGGCAMDPEAGLTGFDFADCEFKKAVIARSTQTIVALTADKLPGVARFVVAKSRDIDVLVVEEGMEQGIFDALAAQDVRIVCA